MLLYKNYIAGWLDSSIQGFLDTFPHEMKSMAFALITCLDSNVEPASLLEQIPALKAESENVKLLNQGLLLPSQLLWNGDLRTQLLFGFDELWFFRTSRISPKPESVWIVGPRRIDQDKLNKLGEWMNDNGCSLALGDGDGLNFIVKAVGLVRYLLAHTVSQPEPTLQMSNSWKEDTGEP